MRFYFVRHGIAEDPGPGVNDVQRRLTVEGVDRMREVATSLAAMHLGIDVLLCSPLVRTRETANVLSEALGLHERLGVDERLAPGFRMAHLQQISWEYPADATLMLVGHQPDMGLVSAQLVGAAPFVLKKGGVVRVDARSVEAGGGILEWFVPPAILALR